MKIFVTYSNIPNCLEFSGSSMNEEFLKKKDIYIPILGGKKFYKGFNEFFKNMKGDDEGNNVSVLNSYINEHSVIYWVGNHLDEFSDDFIGFCHYRRFFGIPDNEILEKNVIYVNEMKSQLSLSTSFLLNHDSNAARNFSEFCLKYIRTNSKDLHLFLAFLESNVLFSGNMFIMHKDKFKDYMKIMNPIYNIIFNMIIPFPNVSDRSYGFILERMTSFAIMKIAQQDKNIKIKQGKYIKLGDTIT